MLHFRGLILVLEKNLLYLPKNFDKKIFYLLLHPMKIVPNRIILLLALVFPIGNCFAIPNPPQPTVPPPMPADNGLIWLLVISVLYGLYKIYHYKTNKKTPL